MSTDPDQNDLALLDDLIRRAIIPLVQEVEVCDDIDLKSKLALVRIVRKYLRHRGWRNIASHDKDVA